MAAFSEFVECVYNHNRDEISTDEDTTSLSDVEPESQDLQEDVFSATESDSDVPDRGDQTISGRTWRYVSPGSTEALIVLRNGGLTARSEAVQTAQDCFNLFINNEIIDTVVRCTNERANEFYSKDCRGAWSPVDGVEIRAFIGLLLIAGRFRDSEESVDFLWRHDTACTRLIYAAVMSRNRFAEIFKFVRFDERATRAERRLTDKLAPLRAVTDIFRANCRGCYEASHRGTVDEQLLPVRGRCPFKVRVRDRPERCGVKIHNLFDAQTLYCCNFDVHLGRAVDDRESIVERLTSFWGDSRRIITTDNSFTDLALAERLLARKIFLVGAIRRNKQDLPASLARASARPLYSSDFRFTHNLTLVAHVPRPRKRLLLLSSAHREHSIAGPEGNYQPDVLAYYNATKSRRDVAEKLTELSCRRHTRRWPLALFMHYIDVAAYNALVVWIVKNPEWERHQPTEAKRKLFLEILANSLYAENIERRAAEFETGNLILHRHVAVAIEATGRKLRRQKQLPAESKKRSRCYICIGNDNKYASKCVVCSRHVCKIHAMPEDILCTQCI